MSKIMRKVLVALDFDHTIINENSDTHIFQLAPNKEIPPELKALYRKSGWTHFMQEVFKYIHQNGSTKENILSCVENLTLTNGMENLFLDLPEDQTEFIIISDSNTVFINHILEKKGLLNKISSVFTNYAEFQNNGCLKVDMYHFQETCDLSTVNLCKGDILSKYVLGRASDGVEFGKIAYVGDGFNDFCPSLRLNECDAVFPRLNYNLIETIPQMKKERNLHLKANVFPWNSGCDILKSILPWYSRLHDEQIPNPRLLEPNIHMGK